MKTELEVAVERLRRNEYVDGPYGLWARNDDESIVAAAYLALGTPLPVVYRISPNGDPDWMASEWGALGSLNAILSHVGALRNNHPHLVFRVDRVARFSTPLTDESIAAPCDSERK